MNSRLLAFVTAIGFLLAAPVYADPPAAPKAPPAPKPPAVAANGPSPQQPPPPPTLSDFQDVAGRYEDYRLLTSYLRANVNSLRGQLASEEQNLRRLVDEAAKKDDALNADKKTIKTLQDRVTKLSGVSTCMMAPAPANAAAPAVPTAAPKMAPHAAAAPAQPTGEAKVPSPPLPRMGQPK